MYVQNNIKIEGARMCFRNFSGKEGKFNPAGRRNFCVLIDDPDMAQTLSTDGWNVKYLRPRDEGDDPQPYLQVAVSFGRINPDIYLIRSDRKQRLNEDDVGILDWAEFKNVDLVLRPYNYSVNGKTGVKAYLREMYATIRDDGFFEKYADIPDSAQSSMFDR